MRSSFAYRSISVERPAARSTRAGRRRESSRDAMLWQVDPSPTRPVGLLSVEERDRLNRAMKETAAEALGCGGVHTLDLVPHRRPTGQTTWWRLSNQRGLTTRGQLTNAVSAPSRRRSGPRQGHSGRSAEESGFLSGVFVRSLVIPRRLSKMRIELRVRHVHSRPGAQRQSILRDSADDPQVGARVPRPIRAPSPTPTRSIPNR